MLRGNKKMQLTATMRLIGYTGVAAAGKDSSTGFNCQMIVNTGKIIHCEL